jgi:mRNA interferase MazF
MPYDFGDVILVKFPFTHQASSKQRPAVVVSNRRYNDAKPDVVMMAITSQLRSSTDFDEVRIVDWQQANLLKPSAIKPVFATLEQPLILRELGKLQTADLAALRTLISAILG